ncbi:hypothetical protein HNY73_016578 [Argiope bruennichi]|uniref:Uncharacterized protein n=1 Tax=Argiope bruennichi TaxID=94029 RepID=A0A8T0EIY3_ARGBR|nr:hypothetical protein HNY73_016578 [Argiope bruennichi]
MASCRKTHFKGPLNILRQGEPSVSANIRKADDYSFVFSIVSSGRIPTICFLIGTNLLEHSSQHPGLKSSGGERGDSVNLSCSFKPSQSFHPSKDPKSSQTTPTCSYTPSRAVLQREKERDLFSEACDFEREISDLYLAKKGKKTSKLCGLDDTTMDSE